MGKGLIVHKYLYLGNYICSKCNDSLAQYIVKDFNIKFNTFIGDFGQVSSTVKNKLFRQYCCSFDGYQNCALHDKNMKTFYITWRKAIRRIWKLPYRAHSRLLPCISDMPSPDVILEKRLMKFVLTGINHENSVVNFMFNLALGNVSTTGDNVRYICQKYNIQPGNVPYVSQQEIDSQILMMFKNGIREDIYELEIR